MKYQPSRSHHVAITDDRVYTPPALASAIVAHFGPTGVVVEACEGAGEEGKSFTRALQAALTDAQGVANTKTFARSEAQARLRHVKRARRVADALLQTLKVLDGDLTDAAKDVEKSQ